MQHCWIYRICVEYQDPNWENEQTLHFWFYVSLPMKYRAAFWGTWEENIPRIDGQRPKRRSWQVLALGVEGSRRLMCRIGNYLRTSMTISRSTW